MMNCYKSLFISLSLGIIYYPVLPMKPYHLSHAEALTIGNKIWQNESGRSKNKLAFWNEKESFPSFGIGHFIWLTKNSPSSFVETFPALIRFFQQKNISIPAWLDAKSECPWASRKAFYAPENNDKLDQLRNLLESTIEAQTEFIITRLYESIPKLEQYAARENKKSIIPNFYKLAQTTDGLYALIDYCNFKGDGTNLKEQYNGVGWGLVQVLDGMDNQSDPITAFADSAKNILTRRVSLSPNKTVEERLLTGWINRIKTYVKR